MLPDMRCFSALAVSAVVLAPLPAVAQLDGEGANALADADQARQQQNGSFGATVGFGQVGEDIYITPIIRFNFEQEMYGFGLQVPLRLRIVDRDPKEMRSGYDDIVRKEDWDEVQDFLRVLRFVYVGRRDKKGLFYVRLGELSGLTLGYGTVMHRYYNTLDINRWHTGLNAAVNFDIQTGGKPGTAELSSGTSTVTAEGELGPDAPRLREPARTTMGVEVMMSDVLDPYVAGFRFRARPLSLALGNGFWDRVETGFTLMGDWRAPLTLEMDANGVVVDPDKQTPNVAERRPLMVAGIDVGVDLLTGSFLSITPYTALNKMSQVDSGWGLHAGVLWGANIPLLIDTLTIQLRTEYQRVSHDYRGPYFNSLYEIERFQLLASAGGGPQTKLGFLRTQSSPPKNGVFLELLAGLPNWVYVGGEYLDYDGGEADGILRLSLNVPALEFVRFSAFYYRINIQNSADLFEIDDRSAIVAQAVVPVPGVPFLTAQGRWWRVWRPGPNGYESVDDWSVGAGFEVAF